MSKETILIVEDSRDLRDLLKTVLESNGYAAECASNGQEALSLLSGQLTHLPGLILLDTQMPLVDGFEFRKKQSIDTRLQNIPVIVMTGDKGFNVNMKMRSPHSVVSKPFNIDFLLNSISEVFSPMIA